MRSGWKSEEERRIKGNWCCTLKTSKVGREAGLGKRESGFGGEDPRFCLGHIELEVPLSYSGGSDWKMTTGFSNMGSAGNFKESWLSEAMRFVWQGSRR